MDNGDTQNEADLHGGVLRWLGTQGYPLEMKVAAAFERAGLSVQQSSYYQDPTTGKSRELDVLAQSSGEWVDWFILTTQFAISCKRVTKPWVVLAGRSEARELTTRTGLLVSSNGAARVVQALWRNSEFHELDLLRRGSGLGYGITEAFGSGNDTAYAATMSAVNFADAAVEHGYRVEAPTRSDQRHAMYAVITVPIVVISAPLFEVSLDQGELSLIEVDRAIVRSGYPLKHADRGTAEVLVATEPVIDGIAREAAALAELISEQQDLLKEAYRDALDDELARTS